MKVREISFRNILSYGNVLQKIEFNDDPRLILVEGENGSGKSSIKEALTVSIYGKSAIRNMKDIPNWINRNASTYVKFDTTSGTTVEISRGVDPNFNEIKIDGSPFNLPDKRKVDEFIEDELTKIPFTVFSNTVSLSFDDFKSFVNLSKDDKRKIVDRMFGIDIITKMRESVKETHRTTKKELEFLLSQIDRNSENIKISKENLKELEAKISKKKEEQVSQLRKSISEKNQELAEVKELHSKIKSKVDEFNSKLKTVRENISQTNFKIRDLGEKIDIYKNNRCPHCLNDLRTESSIKTKDAIESKKKDLEVTLPEMKRIFSEIEKDLKEYQSNQNKEREKYHSISAHIKQMQSDLKKTLDQMREDQVDSIVSLISKMEKDLESDEKSASDQRSELKILDTLNDILSDGGIKKDLLDKVIPSLNSRISAISERLDFKFSFEFNNDFDPIITYLGMQVSPNSLSSGQRKKMNLIVLLAFIEIIKMKHSHMNVMFLDEIFSSLDRNNVYLAIEILREYAIKYNMTVFVVSHEPLPEEFFDYKIYVKSVNNFSEMEMIKNSRIE